jgi:hypothetical protein
MRDDIDRWIARIDGELLPRLRADARFKEAEKLIDRFTGHVADWRAGGAVRALTEDANELAAAAAILALDGSDMVLRYEPPLRATRRTIDFVIEWPDGKRSWIDVKTVAPIWIDDDPSWRRFERLAADFPDNATLVVNRAWCGAAISGQEIKARWSFIRRTMELEQKIALLHDDERGAVRLLLCSNGAFRKDGLEDFADFYRSGRFRQDDWSRNAVARYMQDENANFARTLAGFCFLERDGDAASARELALDVRGPRFVA